LGVKRTFAFALHMSAFDPKRTLADAMPNPFQRATAARSLVVPSSGGDCNPAQKPH
jgi:hypothetical protein